MLDRMKGPILKNRAFFFADYEGTRITRGVSRLTRVPTAIRQLAQAAKEKTAEPQPA